MPSSRRGGGKAPDRIASRKRFGGGEGSRTPVLEAIYASFYMFSRFLSLRSRRCTGTLPTPEHPRNSFTFRRGRSAGRLACCPCFRP